MIQLTYSEEIWSETKIFPIEPFLKIYMIDLGLSCDFQFLFITLGKNNQKELDGKTKSALCKSYPQLLIIYIISLFICFPIYDCLSVKECK